MKNRGTILFTIALPIILVGFFVIAVFTALNYENLTIEIYVIFTLIAIFVFFFGFAIGQRFASPVKKLLERAEQLSRGELSSRIYLETKDEFEELSRAFNKIAEELERSHTEVEKSGEVVDIKVRARTQELEETVDALEQKVRTRAQELQKMITDSEKLQESVENREAEIVKLRKEIKQLRGTLDNKKNKRA